MTMVVLANGNMLTTTVDAIKDYQVCARYYKYLYLDDLFVPSNPREILYQQFETSLKKIASFYFYKRQAGVIPSYNSLINRWEKIWFPKNMDALDMAVRKNEVMHGNLASMSNTAAVSLIKFHEDFSNKSIDPLLIDETFLVQIDNNIRLLGSFDLILRDRDEYKVIMWCGRKRRPAINSLLLDFAALRVAFEHRNKGKKLSVKYYLYDLGTAKPGFVEFHPTDNDVNVLMYWLRELYYDECHVPRRGLTAYCKGCPFDSPCEKFQEWPELYRQ